MEKFDPYYSWLGISPLERPISYYRLLGIQEFESSAAVIENAADRQMGFVRQFATGPRSGVSQQILNELSQAKLLLLDDARRADYDTSLRDQSASGSQSQPEPMSAAPVFDDADLQPISAADPFGTDPLYFDLNQGPGRRNASQQGRRVVLGIALIAMLALLAGVLYAWRSIGQPRETLVDAETNPQRIEQPNAPPAGTGSSANLPTDARPKVAERITRTQQIEVEHAEGEPELARQSERPPEVAQPISSTATSDQPPAVPVDELLINDRRMEGMLIVWFSPANAAAMVLNPSDQASDSGSIHFTPHSLNLHPDPGRAALLVWQSPIAGPVRISGSVADVDPAGGNGVAWKIQIRSRGVVRELAAGALANGGSFRFTSGKQNKALSPTVQRADRIELMISANFLDHRFDTTCVELKIEALDKSQAWDATVDLLANEAKVNPAADRHGDAVWHWSSLPSDAQIAPTP